MAKHVYRSAQREREYSCQSEQDQGVEDRADYLPYHPQNGHAREQRQQHDERLLPVPVQQPASRERQDRINWSVESLRHLRGVNSDSVSLPLNTLIVSRRHAWATF